MIWLTLALAPSLAEARAGSSYSGFGRSAPSSMGSRGTRTFEDNGGSAITRSANPTPQSTSPFGGVGAPAFGGGSFFQRHPFLTGLAGGFLGSWLFHGMGGFGNMFGGLLTVLIIGLLIWFVFRLFSGRGFSFAGAGGMPRSIGAAAAPAQRYRGEDTTVGDDDLNAFQMLHAAVQEAWSRGDLGRIGCDRDPANASGLRPAQYMDDHRQAGNLQQRLAGQAGRGHAGGNQHQSAGFWHRREVWTPVDNRSEMMGKG